MKKHILLFLVLFSSFYTIHAQVYSKKTLHAGESIASQSTYLFPAFKNAEVRMKNGRIITSPMNFNTLISEMQFIDVGGDTLVIAKPEDVASIIFDSTSFFFNNGFYQILAASDSVSLVVLRKASYMPVQIGAMGLPNSTGSGIQGFASIVTHAGLKSLVINEDVEITTQTAYFLARDNTDMQKVNKTGFVKMFPSKEAAIQTYLKQNKTDFGKEADLEKLFAFCSGL